jgi:hypothetical protein
MWYIPIDAKALTKYASLAVTPRGGPLPITF